MYSLGCISKFSIQCAAVKIHGGSNEMMLPPHKIGFVSVTENGYLDEDSTVVPPVMADTTAGSSSASKLYIIITRKREKESEK